jgi:CheY-like chemotaxis protein
MKILVVDDDETFILSAAKALKARGYNVRDHRGPFGTLPLARAWNPDVAFVDANMQGLTVCALVELLGSECPNTRLILTARYSLPRMRRVARELGVGAVPASAFAAPAIPDVLAILAEQRATRAQLY